MENKNVVTKKEDVVVRSSDFVIQHTQKSTFANHYTLDPHILGEGAFGIVQKCFKKGPKIESFDNSITSGNTEVVAFR